MGHKGFLGMAACGLAATVLMPTAANSAQDRVSATEKGSLLIYSKVEVRWDSSGNLCQDTFISMSNDAPSDVFVQMYFINGDAPLYADYGADCDHPGWNFSDVLMNLTGNQPTYWSVADPGGFTPFGVLDPGCADYPGNAAGRFDEDEGKYYIRGMVYGWAVVKDQGGSGVVEIRHNHLSGSATLLNYEDSTAWEYNAWAFQRNVGEEGVVDGDSDNMLDLSDGGEYAPAFGLLLLNFQAVGSDAFSIDGTTVTTNTDVTLHPVSIDFQDGSSPILTKAHYDVWNENEIKLSGAFRCIECWDQTLLSDYGIPNHFLINTLQTDQGKARIDGLASPLCDYEYGEGDDITEVLSEDTALLGVSARDYYFDGDLSARSGTNLIGMGTESASIVYMEMPPPPEAPNSPVRSLEKLLLSR